MGSVKRLMEELGKSYSQFHVVKNIEDDLRKLGFVELQEDRPYRIEVGKNYFVKRNSSSVIAFKVPYYIDSYEARFAIVATHTDSPTFKVKPNPCYQSEGLTMLNVEPYGGMIHSTWLDRPLSIAGRIFYQNDNCSSCERLIAIDEDLLSIPNLAIHMNREINKGFAYNPAKDLIPVLGEADPSFDFDSFIMRKAGIKGTLLSHDLFLYNRDLPRLTGLNQEFLSAPRLDDLASVYCSLEAFEQANDNHSIQIFASFDNEEVGSLTRQGAASDFLKVTLRRIAKALNIDLDEAVARSFLISVDNAHANHPNYPEKSDRTTEVRLNGGPVIKYNANQKYTSDGYSASYIKEIALKNGIPLQEYTNRSDMPGGSTLGNLSNGEISMAACDIGLPQLAMHSSNELMGARDVEQMIMLIVRFLEK